MVELKDTKAAARYEPVAKGDDYCGICRFFLRKQNGCMKVTGFISARAWCKHFEEAANDNR